MNPKVTKTKIKQERIFYFDPDVMGLFQPFQAPMMWRLDLLNYDDVVKNFDIIMYQLETNSMPPDPRTKLPAEAIENLKNWKKNGFPLKAPV